MALKGNLRDFTITQLLNLINLAQKTGTLVIEGPSEIAWVFFLKGKLGYAHFGQDDSNLASILYRSKKLTRSQLNIVDSKASNLSDKELGLLLINANYLSQADIIVCLRNEFLTIVNRLFTWVEGIFQFQNNVSPPEGKITLRISLENIIIEGSRQIREWEQLQDEIPSLDVSLKFSDRPGANLQKVNLSVEEWRVVSYINPKNTIAQIARTTKMNELEIRRIIYGLLHAGLIELTRPARAPILKGRKPSIPGTKEERKSLVNRLISRIRSL